MSESLDKDAQDVIYINEPIDLRPDLSMYGLEEVDRGVCEDSYENRSVLRNNRLRWLTIYDDAGMATGNIQVLSPEMQAARTRMEVEDRRVILTDERDQNSDYITEEALLVEEKADALVPLWVISATRTWVRVREARKEDPKKMPLLESGPGRCRYIKSDGVRCMLWHAGRKTDDSLCRAHMGGRRALNTGAIQKARERVIQSAPSAVDVLEALMESAESEPVRLKAATELLDRAGVRGGIEIDAKVEINERPAEDVIRERLLRLVPQSLPLLGLEEGHENSADEEETIINNGEALEIVTVEVEE
jgi:hypothetical protein